MRDPKSEKTVKDAQDAIEKMFMEAAYSRIGKYSSPLMIDNNLPADNTERNNIIKDILEDLKQRVGDFRKKKLSDEGQERKRQLAINNIEEKINITYELAKQNSSKAVSRLPIMIFIEKIPFDEIVISSILKEKAGY